MRELAILTFQTLDGVMQAPGRPDEDRSGGFEHGGWARPWWDDVMEQVGRFAMADPYDVLLGRTTYDLFAANFPSAGEEHPLNRATKYVVTSKPTDLPWAHSIPIQGDVVDQIQRLKREDAPLLQVHGSWQLVQFLREHELIDEFRIWTFPLLLGGRIGKRLFSEGAAPKSLDLVRTEPTASGAVMTIYRPS